MNRFSYELPHFENGETIVATHRNIKIYDGDQKTIYEEGELVLTTHRLFWGMPGHFGRGVTLLSLPLKYISGMDEEVASSFVFGKKKRIILNLKQADDNKLPGPVDNSREQFIKLSGRSGIEESFVHALYETQMARIWEASQQQPSQSQSGDAADNLPRIKLRSGIVGIERTLQERQKQTDENINLAFKDLNKLMTMAKDMVNISKAISAKICERQGDISDDETVRFKSYLMSLGIDDPVTRDSGETDYFQRLANQLCEMLLDPLTEAGGMMSLADVYCRVNRARGLELLSPEDLLNACRQLQGPIKLRKFPSGAMVLQLESHDDEAVARDTSKKVEEEKSLNIEELARSLGISLLLAQERLLTAERLGKVCRDDSIEGLRFYPNLFLQIDEIVD